MKEIFDDDLYNIEWRDIENAGMDYENYHDDIEGFFKEDFVDEDTGDVIEIERSQYVKRNGNWLV